MKGVEASSFQMRSLIVARDAVVGRMLANSQLRLELAGVLLPREEAEDLHFRSAESTNSLEIIIRS